MLKRVFVLTALAVSVTSAVSHQKVIAQGTITDGNAAYTITTNLSAVTQATGAASYFVSNLLPNGLATTDHLFSNGFFYRVTGDTRERPFFNATGTDGISMTLNSQTYVGNVATFQYTEALNGTPRFSATIQYTLLDGVGLDNATLYQQITVTNLTGTALNFNAYLYNDAAISGQDANDQVLSVDTTGGNILMNLNDSVTLQEASFFGEGATNWEAGTFATVSGIFNNAFANDLTNSTAPFGPTDIALAMQWVFNINPGESVTVGGYYSVGPVVPIPEPSTYAFIGLSLLLVNYGMRRGLRAATKSGA